MCHICTLFNLSAMPRDSLGGATSEVDRPNDSGHNTECCPLNVHYCQWNRRIVPSSYDHRYLQSKQLKCFISFLMVLKLLYLCSFLQDSLLPVVVLHHWTISVSVVLLGYLGLYGKLVSIVEWQHTSGLIARQLVAFFAYSPKRRYSWRDGHIDGPWVGHWQAVCGYRGGQCA